MIRLNLLFFTKQTTQLILQFCLVSIKANTEKFVFYMNMFVCRIELKHRDNLQFQWMKLHNLTCMNHGARAFLLNIITFGLIFVKYYCRKNLPEKKDYLLRWLFSKTWIIQKRCYNIVNSCKARSSTTQRRALHQNLYLSKKGLI